MKIPEFVESQEVTLGSIALGRFKAGRTIPHGRSSEMKDPVLKYETVSSADFEQHR